MNIFLLILIFLLVCILLILSKTNKKLYKERNFLARELETKKSEIEISEGDILKRNYEISELKGRISELKKDKSNLLESFSIPSKEIESTLLTIEKYKTVYNKNKIILLKALVFYFLSNPEISINNLFVNKMSIAENIKIVRKYFVYSNVTVAEKDKLDLGKALLTLICFNNRK